MVPIPTGSRLRLTNCIDVYEVVCSKYFRLNKKNYLMKFLFVPHPSWFPPEADFNCIDGYEVAWTNTQYPDESGSTQVSANTYSLKIGE